MKFNNVILSMSHSLQCVCWLSLLLTFCGGLCAQPPEPAPLRFRIMGMDSIVSGLCFIQEDGIQSFTASHSRPTAWLEYRGPFPLKFYRRSDLEALTEESAPPPVMASFMPQQAGDWLLLFVRDPQAGDFPRYVAVPIPDVVGDIREGVRFYNLTRNELAISLNGEVLRVLPGQQQQVNPVPGHNAGMDMQIAALRESGWETFSSTVFGHRPNARITYFLMEVGGRFQFKRFLEQIEAPAE